MGRQYSFHPIANIFPLIADSDVRALAADIKLHGQREPAWLFEGKLLDGRNRARACELTGIKLRTREFKGSRKEALAYVWSINFHRRHLTSSQAAIALAERKKLDPDFVAEVLAPVQEEAKAKQKQAGSRGGEGGRGRKKPLSAKSDKGLHARKTATIIAKAHGTNAKAVASAEKLLAERPDLAEKIKTGEKTVTQAVREMKRDETARSTAPLPDGKYRVFYADPPWKYGDDCADGGVQAGGAAFHYPAMTIAQLCDLPIKDMVADNAVLFLWVTSPILPECFAVIKAWGFAYKASFVWDKVKHNMGHYNSVRHEFLLICTRGSCLPDVKELIDSVQSIERSSKHSQKPEQFRTIIDKLYTQGKRIELFARSAAKGWKAWGNEHTDAA